MLNLFERIIIDIASIIIILFTLGAIILLVYKDALNSAIDNIWDEDDIIKK